MIATGTGIAPFASIMRDPETYEKFEQVFLTHTCREVAELAYGEELAKNLVEDPLIGELVEGRFVHYATATREPYVRTGRITTLIETGKLFSALRPRRRPGDDLRLDGHAARRQGAGREGGAEGRLQRPAGRVRRRAGVRRLKHLSLRMRSSPALRGSVAAGGKTGPKSRSGCVAAFALL
jgi:ferredoxin--NADP+ reductase